MPYSMNEGQEYLDPELLKDAEATNQRPALSAEGEELKTTQFAGMLASAGGPLPSFPPPESSPYAADAAFSAPRPGYAGQPAYAAQAQAQPQAAIAPAARPAKPSWLRALLATMSGPAAEGHASKGLINPHVAGIVFASLGLVFAGVALVTGLRGAPSDATMAPAVAAALVLARALVALGAGALSFGMLRQAERLLVVR
jgi:hypothetical protein